MRPLVLETRRRKPRTVSFVEVTRLALVLLKVLVPPVFGPAVCGVEPEIHISEPGHVSDE